MKKYTRTETQIKVIEGMNKVYGKLIEFKKKAGSELVVLQNNQIIRIKPE